MPGRLRLLWVTPYLPRRGIRAAQERWWALLARLARRHEVTLVAFVDPEDAAVDGVPEGLAAVHRIPKLAYRPEDPLALLPQAVAGGYTDPALRAAVAEQLKDARFDLVQYEFVEMAHLMPPAPIPAVLTVHQLGFAQQGPRWRAEGGGLGRRAVLLHRYLRDLDFELTAVTRARRVITMSAEDAARLARFHPALPISVLPCGVDCTEFRPRATPPPVTAELVFVGHFGHPPNVDAVRFLARDVLPRLGRARLRIVGRGVTSEVAALARPGTVFVVGAVSDVRPELAAAAVVVAPVRFGTGMRGKVLEALAMGRPVVTTSVGAEGLGAVSGRELLIADDAPAFAAAVRRVLDEPGLGAALGAAGRALVVSRFDWDAIAAAHDDVYESVPRAPAPAVRDPGGPPRLAALAGRLGYVPGLAAGFGVLLARAARWHIARLARPRRGAVAAPPVPLRA